MQIKTDGLIIKTRDTGENDTVVTVLTREYGLITAFANGSKRFKGRSAGAAVSPMTYSQLTLFRGRDSYIIDDAKASEVFFGLREDINRLALAQYFCELAGEFAPENTDADEFLRLLLNLLYMLSENRREPEFLKPVGELRMLALAGFSPALLACAVCGEETPQKAAFNVGESCFYCERCGTGLPVSAGVICAMRHIVSCEDHRLFSFKLPESSLRMLSDVCEKSVTAQLGRVLKTLSFYHSLG